MIKDYRIMLVLTFVAVAALLASVGLKIRPDYITLQKDYYERTDLKDGDVGVKQINVTTQNGLLIDRCTTCHLGATNQDAVDFPKPLAFHPVIVPDEEKDPHDLNKMGCVVCHDGNGRAVESYDAHGHFHDWYAPLLTGRKAQANCAQCHDTAGRDLRGAELFNRGKRLYIERTCFACHTIKGVSTGKSAPDLTDAGGKFNLDYLIESIVDPTANTAVSKMPTFDWVDNTDDVLALAVYLKGQRLRKYRDPDYAPIGMEGSLARFAVFNKASADVGRQIFLGESTSDIPVKGGCINCHSYRDSNGKLSGGTNGPDVTMTYRTRGKDYILGHIRNPRGDVMDSPMPAFTHYNDAELESLALFLQNMDYTFNAGNPPSGSELYQNYCISCHGRDFDGKGDLARILDPLPRNFKKPQFMATYADRFKDSVKEGVAGTAMAPWQDVLSDAEVDALLTFILDQTRSDVRDFKRYDAKLPQVGDSERRSYRKDAVKLTAGDIDRGRAAYQKFCTSCHGKLANGKGPNAYYLQHPLPRNLLSKPYMNQASLDDQRLYESILLGVPGTPMPPHDHLKDQTILDMIAFIRANSESDQ
ncbi:c-type cytochrome [Planctomycetota bacterium]